MLGWLLFGLATAALGVIIINGIITENKIQEQLQSKGIEAALLKEINSCTNTVKVYDLVKDESIEIRGDGISDELFEGELIIV